VPSPTRLYFAVAPVQAFVAQSRRTRDLWASSYLLSFLTKAALEAVKRSGGVIVLPADSGLVDRAFAEGPPHGNVPNRFVAEAADPVLAAQKAMEAFGAAWQKIAQAVWDAFLASACNRGNNTRAIWDRQVRNFWELNWVVGSADDDPLPRRKKWRTSPVTIEPGDHCSVMGQWQELSGFVRSVERDNQDKFWERIRQGTDALDLDTDERLCAMALIKRLFPRVAQNAVGRELRAENWPSTPYLAAIPWLRKIGQDVHCTPAYAAHVTKVAKQPLGERYTRIGSLVELSKKKNVGDLFRLDGNFFHERALRNAKVTPLENDAERDKLLESLKELNKHVGHPASSFYALLLMDGDSMGELLRLARTDGKEGDVAKALGNFAAGVPRIVSRHDGIAVYAGGDDLLALLPYDSALRCAWDLRDMYRSFFKDCGDTLASRATLSGALLYCDYHLPFRSVLQSAHHLLDDIAKDATGRDSLAIALWKGSGLAAQWAAPWKHLCKPDGNLLHLLAAKITAQSTNDARSAPTGFSSSFLYRLRELFASLTDDPLDAPGSFGNIVEMMGLDLQSLLVAEHVRGLSHRLAPEEADRLRTQAESDTQLLLKVCFRVTRKSNGEVVTHDGTGGVSPQIGFDGVRVAHFLANLGADER
jgi:CRISPR-associated protein Cmr2